MQVDPKKPFEPDDLTVSRWIAAFNAHNVTAIVALYKDDASLFDSGMKRPRQGQSEITNWFTWRFTSMPSISYTPHGQFVDDDGRLVVRWTARGVGPRLPGLSSRSFQVEGESRFVLHDRLIADQRGTYDHLSVLRQIIPALQWLPEGVARSIYSLYLWRSGQR